MYDDGVKDVTVFILAGGKSSRMGVDKAFIQLAGETLLERALKLARTMTAEVRISGDAAKFASYGKVVDDVFRGCGPLGGIHAALNHTGTDLNLMLAVDLPFVTSDLLEYLIGQAQASAAMVVVPESGRKLQPLCATYRKPFAEIAEQALRAGKYKIDPLFSEVGARILEEAEFISAGFSPEMFRNLNTPEDLAEAERHLLGTGR